jgi:hypothetical protein
MEVGIHGEKSFSRGGSIESTSIVQCILGIVEGYRVPRPDAKPFEIGWDVRLVIAPGVDAIERCAREEDPTESH